MITQIDPRTAWRFKAIKANRSSGPDPDFR